ncbi:ion transporter [Gallibacterium trehalosifermentans]|uniref:Ion transporter n=1 Tax=Gallibacterium trehalosifermentans TaxID=516935 RepID=A0ABV6H1K6_9PAST
MKVLNHLVNNKKFQNFIIAVIIFNAFILGLDTYNLDPKIHNVIEILDEICLVIYTIELIFKIIAFGRHFIRSGWNIFDFFVVAVCFMPAGSDFAVLRLLRIFRILRLLSAFPSMRLIVSALLNSLSAMVSICCLLMIFFYIYAVLCVGLFGEAFPQFFGTLGESLYSLFQIMTLESWSMGIARPVIAVFPYAWIIFISFILIMSFIVLNLAIGVVVNSIGELSKQNNQEETVEITQLHKEVMELKQLIKNLSTNKFGEN